MSPRDLATQHALGRVGMGVAMVAVPRLVAQPWVGRAAAAPGAQVITAAMGARDLAIGLGTVRALRAGRGARPWLQAAALADTVDLVATLRARHDLPRFGVATVTALAAGSAVLSAWLYTRLP
jgi:hypothetical protein